MRIVRLAKLITMNVVEFVPCTAGSASSSGACSTCHAGANPARSDAVGRRNMLYTNSACQALGVTNRIPMRWFGSAPANRSRTNRSEEHTSELQSQSNLVCRLLLEKKKRTNE